jgi:LPS-assembly protein
MLSLPLPQESAPPAGGERPAIPSTPQRAPVASFDRGEQVTIRAREQEKAGDVYTLRGDVEIEFRNYLVRADYISYDAASGEITAEGHVTLSGGLHDEHITASRGRYNVRSETGEFRDVVATTGARFRGRNVTLTSSSPFAFTGERVEKVGRSRYIVHNGSVTSCEMPNPIWTLNAQKIVLEVGDKARIVNSTFRIKKVPVFYLPFASHPVDELGRQSGFLVPGFGQSSRKGTIVGESVYWAINRSMDATLGAEYYSRRGWAQMGQFRARPSEKSYLDLSYFGVLDRGVLQNTAGGLRVVDQGGQDVHLDGETPLPLDFRGVANLNYLSSYVFRLAFTESFSETVNSEVKSLGFASRTRHGYFLNARFARYQNFQSTEPGDVIKILHTPGIDLGSVERPLFNTPLHWSFDAALEGLSRSEPRFVTNDFVPRVDLYPRLSLPIFQNGWTIRSELGLRNTYYAQRRLPNADVGVPVDDPVNRRTIEFGAELRPPTLARIFDRELLGHRLKHAFEPRVNYRVVKGIDNFQNIIRFDARDILADTNEFEFALLQRLYAKSRPSNPECARAPREETGQSSSRPATPLCSFDEERGRVREIASWELRQKYFLDEDFGGAVVPGKRNVLTTTAMFSGIAFLTEARRWSPLVSELRIRAGENTDGEWQLDIDHVHGRINSSTTFVNYRIGYFFLGGSHAFLRTPGEIFTNAPTALPAPDRFNQFRALVGYGAPGKRGLSVAANVGVDVNFEFLQYGAAQVGWNWSCCGVAAEYRRFALGQVRNENQVRFAFTLANIGTFGNLRRRERLF